MDNGCVSAKDIILRLFFTLSYQVSGAINSAGRNMIERAHEAVLAGIKFFFGTYWAIEGSIGGGSSAI